MEYKNIQIADFFFKRQKPNTINLKLFNPKKPDKFTYDLIDCYIKEFKLYYHLPDVKSEPVSNPVVIRTHYPVLGPGQKDLDLIEVEQIIAKARKIDDDFTMENMESNKKLKEESKEISEKLEKLRKKY